MANYPNILGEFFNLGGEQDDEFEMIARAVIEDEQMTNQRRRTRRRGSVPGHITINRCRAQGLERLYLDYFAEPPVFPARLFRRRFRMSRRLFCRIQDAVEAKDSYFVQRRDAVGVLVLSSLQKVTAAFRMIAYGAAADSVDQYVRIGESTAIESLKKFVKAVVDVFSDTYLRSPNNNDIARLLAIGEQRGFPGMLGSIDCMHWKWKNCPTSWDGMYTSHIREPTIILEVVASQDFWIWHAFFGMPGSLNDINVLKRSPVFSDLSHGRATQVNYTINGHDYTLGYYLADGIYPKWATLVKTIPCPLSLKNQYFAKAQESARKDVVERAFGVLQARFAIVRGPARYWEPDTLADIMKACIIMHNMVIEDEGDGANDLDFDPLDAIPLAEPSRDPATKFDKFLETRRKIKNRATHEQLQADLVEHLWERYGIE